MKRFCHISKKLKSVEVMCYGKVDQYISVRHLARLIKPNTSPLPLAFRVEGDSFKYAGDYHSRHAELGTDVDVCFSGKIAISLLGIF